VGEKVIVIICIHYPEKILCHLSYLPSVKWGIIVGRSSKHEKRWLRSDISLEISVAIQFVILVISLCDNDLIDIVLTHLLQLPFYVSLQQTRTRFLNVDPVGIGCSLFCLSIFTSAYTHKPALLARVHIAVFKLDLVDFVRGEIRLFCSIHLDIIYLNLFFIN
jgi:hypothetical protein